MSGKISESDKKTRKSKKYIGSVDRSQSRECWLMLAPFMLLFTVFTIIPVLISLPVGFTNFDMVNTPDFVGLSNYKTLFLSDKTFINSIRVTLIFALFSGPVSYVLCFLLAWLINELHPKLKTIFTLIFFAILSATPFKSRSLR